MNMLVAFFCILLFSPTAPLTRISAMSMPATSIALTSIGSVTGFSTFLAFAMKEVPSNHAAVTLASMPMVTAAYAVFRDHKHPGNKFWIFAICGTILSFSFFVMSSVRGLLTSDLLLVLAVLSSSFSYMEGGRMSRDYGGMRIMTRSVLFTLPFSIPFSIWYFNHVPLQISDQKNNVIYSLAYLALVSQSSGMFLCFRVLAKGPMEKVALVQLLQPFFTLVACIVLLNERVQWHTWLIALSVACCIVGANREHLQKRLPKQT